MQTEMGPSSPWLGNLSLSRGLAKGYPLGSTVSARVLQMWYARSSRSTWTETRATTGILALPTLFVSTLTFLPSLTTGVLLLPTLFGSLLAFPPLLRSPILRFEPYCGHGAVDGEEEFGEGGLLIALCFVPKMCLSRGQQWA
jgi:hypothetical protein